ncbi:Scaffold-type E3 ligase [Didymella sp. IMI 355093]|nr:Scaffold-type E3 ligase [Didymella sp. IMI 355093]
MPLKRRAPDTDTATTPVKKKAKVTKESYTTQQKAAISQFMSFTNMDRTAAVRVLKSHGWDAQNAVNAYYSGGGGGSNTSATTKTALNKLFDKYRENATAEPDLVGVDGAMEYLQELQIDLEGLDSLAALEIIQAPTMGEITREGFVNGWLERDCDTIEKQKTYINNLKTQLPSDRTVFTRIYKYTFFLAKTGQQKAVSLEPAMAYWDLLFSSPLSAVKWTSPNTPWLDWWKEFLEASWKKSVNKDMWNETLKFAQLTLEDEAISFWNEESSWPSVIDDFVEWVKNEKRGGAEQKTEEMEY